MWHTLSRSYSANLPSSLTSVLSSALVFSTYPPESVCGTVTNKQNAARSFSWKHGIDQFPHHLSALSARFIPTQTAYRFVPESNHRLTYPSPSLLCYLLVVQEY